MNWWDSDDMTIHLHTFNIGCVLWVFSIPCLPILVSQTTHKTTITSLKLTWIHAFSVTAATFSTSLTLPTTFQPITYNCFWPDPISAIRVLKWNYMYTRLVRLFMCMQFDQKTHSCNTVYMHERRTLNNLWWPFSGWLGVTVTSDFSHSNFTSPEVNYLKEGG